MAYVHAHVEFRLFYKRNWPLSLLVVLVFEKFRFFFFFFFHYFISTVASTFCAFLKSVHWNNFFYMWIDVHAQALLCAVCIQVWLLTF